MSRMTRAEVFDPDEIATVHVYNRTTRRCFLLGKDPLTGKNYDHRKSWCEQRLIRLAAQFGIDLLGYAILSNHFHLVLRSRPDVVASWNDTEVAGRWLRLCPLRKTADGDAEEPSEHELNTIRNDPQKLAKIRRRLSDISWWMRLLCQKIAQRANREDGEVGKFWQARFKAVRLLDEAATLACTAYVDLNPIRAAMAQTIEGSDFTSAQRRLAALKQTIERAMELEGEVGSPEMLPPIISNVISATHRESLLEEEGSRITGSQVFEAQVSETQVSTNPNSTEPSTEPSAGGNAVSCSSKTLSPDRHLSPILIDELLDPIGPCASQTGFRASDKGFLPISAPCYLELLDWTAREVRSDKRGSTPSTLEPLFERLQISGETWCSLVKEFGRLFYTMAGKPHVIASRKTRDGRRRHRTKAAARQLLSASKPGGGK